MSSASALPQTLKSITATKIKELSKQRALFEKRRDEITKAANEAPDIRTKARILLEGVTRLKGHPNDALDKDDDDVESDDSEGAAGSDEDSNGERAGNRNIRRFLLQSRYDPSVTRSVLEEWIARLERELGFLGVKHEHATFYSDLVTEWLSNLDGREGDENEEKSEASGSGFEEVGRKEMHEQRAMWESLVFTTADINPDDVERYLESLFTGTKPSKQALDELREKIKNFGTEFMTRRKPISVDTLKWVTNALLKSDLLTTEKAAILKELLRNKEVAQEVVDVLNMRLASLDSWNWGSEGIPMEMRRQLNGKYRVFMDPDLLDSLFHQYIGVEWCVAFRSAFHALFCTRAWKSFSRPIPKRDRERRQYFLNEQRPQSGLDDYRKHVYQRDYFLSQFPTSVDEGVRSYDDEGNDEGNTAKNPVETKHSLLHLLITESIIHTTLRGEFTVIRSDFKWFGPSLPHATILAVLKFFGVQKEWLDFFRVFLEAPVKFVQDGPDATPQVRKRGIPMSYALSTCFGEAVLFCMDYAVNQHADGAFLYRLHDDFWFWGEEKTCVKAWKAMSQFAQVMGIEFNEEKTGTVRLGEKNDGFSKDGESDPLPKGEIRWGFLKLDSKEGAFVIDQEQVDAHIEELRRQLSACKSVFAWVQAWNSYFARFFTNNFARPAMCFGRRHIDMVASTLSRIEHELFPTSTDDGATTTAPASFSGSVTDYLRNVIAERFNVHDLPDGFFYFPVELGGLELRNPFIPFLAMREDIKQSPKRTLEKAFLEEEDRYHAAKERFEKDGSSLPKPDDDDDDDAATTFFSFDEYTRYREVHSRPLLDAYRYLIRVPGEIGISKTPEFQSSQAWLDENIDKTGTRGVISSKWQKMSPYWKWVAELYHAGMLRKYGGLAAVDREFMPLGVVKVLREGKVRWQG